MEREELSKTDKNHHQICVIVQYLFNYRILNLVFISYKVPVSKLKRRIY